MITLEEDEKMRGTILISKEFGYMMYQILKPEKKSVLLVIRKLDDIDKAIIIDLNTDLDMCKANAY